MYICIFVYLFIVEIYVYFLSAYVCVLIKHSVFTYMHACIYVLACVYVCMCWCVHVHVHVHVSLVYNTSISCIYVYMSVCVNEYRCGYMCMHFIKITLTFICRIQYTAQFLIQYNFNNYHEVILKHSHIISLY